MSATRRSRPGAAEKLYSQYGIAGCQTPPPRRHSASGENAGDGGSANVAHPASISTTIVNATHFMVDDVSAFSDQGRVGAGAGSF